MVIPLGNDAKPGIAPWATWVLIALNLACFGLTLIRPDSFLVAYAATPYELTHNVDLVRPVQNQTMTFGSNAAWEPITIHHAPGPVPIRLTLITGLFLHANLAHLVGNMVFLFIFGQKIEEAFGRPLYLLFYLGCGVVGTITQVAAEPNSLTPCLGASGAIAGVMGAYLVWFPRDRVRVLCVNVMVLIPAYAVIGGWIASQFIRESFLFETIERSSGVAYLAHIGGAATGIIVSLPLSHGKQRRSQKRPGQDQQPPITAIDA